MLQSSQGEVAATEVAHDGGDMALLVEQVELGMQIVAQEEFDDNALRFELRAQASQPFLILVGWRAHQ